MSRDANRLGSSIPQANPGANYVAHRKEITAAIDRVLRSGSYVLGSEVREFEREFASYLGVENAVGVASGTDALTIALLACDVGPGDAVLTVAHTSVATVVAIERSGATPVLIDIDRSSLNMDPHELERAVKACKRNPSLIGSRRLRCVIPVHLYGNPADMPAIRTIADDYDIVVIEDGAQAHGAEIRKRKVGTWGDAGAFSFYPTKNLGCIGDGGMVVSRNREISERARLFRQYGWREKFVSILQGLNSRLDELQAAILRVKLRHLDRENARREKLARTYQQILKGTDLQLPEARPGSRHVFHQYVVRTTRRDALRAHLDHRQIGTQIHYPFPIHLQPAYLDRLTKLGTLGQTEAAAREVLSLPMFPELGDRRATTVANEVRSWLDTRMI